MESLASEARSCRPQLTRLMRYSWFIIIANHGPSAFDCPPALLVLTNATAVTTMAKDTRNAVLEDQRHLSARPLSSITSIVLVLAVDFRGVDFEESPRIVVETDGDGVGWFIADGGNFFSTR
ncbi:hypothetical protein KM043_014695 [Ampulex compressa]|nr:hypothetical protein KM043_014695 [Ampulex compressa]